jgi:urate oxidase
MKALWKPPRDPTTNIITSKGKEKPIPSLENFLNFVSKEFIKVEQQKNTLKTDTKQETDSAVKA